MFDQSLRSQISGSRLRLVWSTKIPGMIRVPIFSSDLGRGYVISYVEKKRQYKLIEFCAKTGQIGWTLEIKNGGYGTPSITGGTLATATDFGSIAGVDIRCGKLKWIFETGTRVRSPIQVTGNNFLFSSGKSIFELDSDGGVVRRIDLDGAFFYGMMRNVSGLMISLATLHVAGKSKQYVVAFNSLGRLSWKFDLGIGCIISSDTSGFELHDGYIYVAGLNSVNCISAKDGDCVWRLELDDVIGRQMPTYHEKRLFVPATSGGIIGIDCDTGAILWRFCTDSPVYTPVSVCGGRLVASADGLIYILDAANGKPIDQIPTGHSPYSAIVFYKNMAYLGGGDSPYHGRLYGFECVGDDHVHRYICTLAYVNAHLGSKSLYLNVEVSNVDREVDDLMIDSSPISATMSNGELFEAKPYDRIGNRFLFELPLRDTIVPGTYVLDIFLKLIDGDTINRTALVQIQKDDQTPRRIILPVTPVKQEAALLSGAAVLQMLQSYYEQEIPEQHAIREMIDYSRQLAGYESWNTWRIMLRRLISSQAKTLVDLPEYLAPDEEGK